MVNTEKNYDGESLDHTITRVFFMAVWNTEQSVYHRISPIFRRMTQIHLPNNIYSSVLN